MQDPHAAPPQSPAMRADAHGAPTSPVTPGPSDPKALSEPLSDPDENVFSAPNSHMFSFSTPSDEDDEGFGNSDSEEDARVGSSLMPFTAPSFTKLEVITASEITRLLRWVHFAVAIVTVATAILIILANSKYVKPYIYGNIHVFPDAFMWFNAIAGITLFAYIVVLFVVYTFRILHFVEERERIHEQVWAMVLTFSVLIYLVPFYPARDITYLDGIPIAEENWYDTVSTVIIVIMYAAFISSTMFFIWTSAHSYRILRGPLPLWFYVPKFVTLFLYILFKEIVLLVYNVTMAPVPFTSFLTMLRLFSDAGVWPKDYVVSITLVTIYEIFIVMWILRDILVTKNVLKQADYMRFRSKQVGFRFFLYNNTVFVIFYWLLYFLLSIALPTGGLVFRMMSPLLSECRVDSQENTIALYVLLLIYVTVEAYTKLPANSNGIKGWFVPNVSTQGAADNASAKSHAKHKASHKPQVEPIRYRKREPPLSSGGVTEGLQSNVFIMQTQVIMFNFAWFVYYYGTPKLEKFTPKQDVFKFAVAAFITDKDTDTNVIVVDGEDRIVVSFRGTTSLKNLRTDLSISHCRFDSVLPTRVCDRYKIGPEWREARIHQGFSRAYVSVSNRIIDVVDSLIKVKRRPVFLTGHSLGGCLATLCSADLIMCLGMRSQEIVVSTFGAPRTGNRAFVDVYNALVPNHWRIVVGPDLIPKLPKVWYHHVGKKVLLTTNGELFIDPNALEIRLWHGDATSVLYHRKASYLLAMRAWCLNYHGETYIPEFWPWPINEDDSRRFEHALSERSSKFTSESITSSRKLMKRVEGDNWRSRLGAVDLLSAGLHPGVEDTPRPEVVISFNETAVKNWAKVTYKLMQKHEMRA